MLTEGTKKKTRRRHILKSIRTLIPAFCSFDSFLSFLLACFPDILFGFVLVSKFPLLGQWLIVTVYSDPDTATTAISVVPPPSTATMPKAQEVVPASAGEEAVEKLVEENAAVTASAGGGVVSSSASWCLATLGGIITLAALVVVA